MKDLESKIKNFINEINPDTLKILKFGNMLPTIVKNFLVYEIASMVSIEKNVRENEIKNFYLKNNINNTESLSKILKAKKLTKEELHYQITLPLKIYKFAEENYAFYRKQTSFFHFVTLDVELALSETEDSSVSLPKSFKDAQSELKWLYFNFKHSKTKLFNKKEHI